MRWKSNQHYRSREHHAEQKIVVAGNCGHPTRSIIRILLTANQEVDQTGKYFDLLKDTMVYVNGCVPLVEEEEILRVLKPRGTIEPHIYY